jgi:hypothetical protein
MKLTIESQNKEEVQLVKSYNNQIKKIEAKIKKLDEKDLFDDFPKQKYDLYMSELESKILELIEEKT